MYVHLAAELIFHRKVNKADASSDQCINEADCVQPRLELRRHHAHENLPTQGLNTVLALHPLTYTLCRHDEGNGRGKRKVTTSQNLHSNHFIHSSVTNLYRLSSSYSYRSYV